MYLIWQNGGRDRVASRRSVMLVVYASLAHKRARPRKLKRNLMPVALAQAEGILLRRMQIQAEATLLQLLISLHPCSFRRVLRALLSLLVATAQHKVVTMASLLLHTCLFRTISITLDPYLRFPSLLVPRTAASLNNSNRPHTTLLLIRALLRRIMAVTDPSSDSSHMENGLQPVIRALQASRVAKARVTVRGIRD